MRRSEWKGSIALVAVALLAAQLALPGMGRTAPRGGPALSSPLPVVPHRPGRGDSVLVFAAHPDDETLGAGGFIHAAIAAGARVTVVIFTNGDGYLEGVDVGFHTLFSTPDRFVAYGKQRQTEALAAAARLGVPPAQVVFLGYPDRGLAVLWGPRWTCDRPYTSPYTRADHSPYPLSYRAGALYCGEDVLADVVAVLRRERPTVIITHHPEDTHRDHWAAGAFVTLAFETLVLQGEEWPRTVSVRHFLVHHGVWPVPGVYAPDLDLQAPRDLWEDHPEWLTLSLDQADEDAKRLAILEYHSQARLLRTYMLSFVRRNELFDLCPAVHAPQVGDEDLPFSSAEAWDRLPPAIRAPRSGSLLRATEGSAILDAVAVGQSPARLFVALRLRQPVIREVQYRMELRLFYADGHTARQFLRFEVSRRLAADRHGPQDLPLPPGAAARSFGRLIAIVLPREGLGDPVSLYLRVVTVGPFRTVVDGTPWTLIRLGATGARRSSRTLPVETTRRTL
jgi:LmbE family N-acetylglucosaminyl deacetylase